MVRATQPRTEREAREHKARRSIAAGGGVLLLGFVVGCIVSFIPVATGQRMNPPFDPSELGWVVIAGSLGVSLLGLVLVLYGLVQLGLSRRRDAGRHDEEAHA